MNWYFDTSVLVAAASDRHPHYASAASILEEMFTRKHRGFFSAHGLTEFYSVLTRTPFKPPFFPSEAWQIIDAQILPHFDLVALTPKDYKDVVRLCAERRMDRRENI